MATLNQISTKLLRTRNANGQEILQHIHNMVEHIAKEHDWDAAARWLRATNKENASDSVLNRTLRMCIAAYFGGRLTLKSDVTHDTGYRFTFGTDGKWPEGEVPEGNDGAYAVVRNAVENKADVNNAQFQKGLREAIRKEKEEPTADEKRVALARKAKRDVEAIIKSGLEPYLYMAFFKDALKKVKKEEAKEQAVASETDVVVEPETEEQAAA